MRALILALSLAGSLCAELPEMYRSLPRILWVVDNAQIVASAWTKAGAAYDYKPKSVFTAPSNAQVLLARGGFGNVQTYWIQPVSGDSAFARFRKTHKQGIFSLAYGVLSPEAMQTEINRLQSLGVRVLERGKMLSEGHPDVPYVVFDTAAQGKFTLGLIYDETADVAPSSLKITQFALVARDSDAVSAYWQKLGFPAFRFTHPDISDKLYRGSPAEFDMRLGWQNHLSIPFEWIQPLKGPNVYEDHIAKYGEGFHHIAFQVEDMEEANVYWKSLGYPISMSGAWGTKGKPGSGRFAYHDTHSIGGIDIELLWNYRWQYASDTRHSSCACPALPGGGQDGHHPLRCRLLPRIHAH